VTPWAELYREHEAMRAVTLTDLLGQIRERLIELAKKNHCNSTIQGRVTYRAKGQRREIYISNQGGKEEGTKEGTEPLRNLPHLKDATLTVLALIERDNELRELTLMLRATRTGDGTPLTIAIHLTDKPQGSGACAHALLHTHVGPTHEAKPKVRVPLPAVGPVALLDWLLSQVVPDWEPAPWQDLVGQADL